MSSPTERALREPDDLGAVEATLDGSDNGASAGEEAAGAAVGAAVERGAPLAVARAVGARRVVGRARERGGRCRAPCPMRGARSTAVALGSARSSMSIGDMGDENPKTDFCENSAGNLTLYTKVPRYPRGRAKFSSFFDW